MAIISNPSLVMSGLILALDAANTKSYPGSGTTWTDISANGRVGTLTNGPTYNSANSGSITFTAASSNSVLLTGSTAVSQATFTVWLRRNGSQNDYAGILFTRGGVSSSISGLSFFSTVNNLGYNWNNAVAAFSFNSGLTVPDGVWCMAALSLTSTAATLYLCQSSGTTSATNTLAHSSTTFDGLKLGWDGTASSRYMNGSIASAHLYNRALSASEIQQNFNALRGRFSV
jgi:hypothetical protein